MDEILGEHRLAEALRGDEDDVLALGDKVEREDAVDGGAMDLLRPGPLEIGHGLEAADRAPRSAGVRTRWRARASSSAWTTVSSRTTGLQRFCVARAIRSLRSVAVWVSPSWRRCVTQASSGSDRVRSS